MVTISVVTWNSAGAVGSCIESILNQSYADFELIVVDNHSQDSTCDIVAGFRDPRITLIKLPENAGYCGGHNTAIRHSRGSCVLLANPDSRMNHDYVERALQQMGRDGKIGTVCGLLVQSDRSSPDCRIDSAGLDILRDRRCRLRHHGRPLSDIHLSAQEVFGADGALPLYRRAMIDDVAIGGNLFDERFFAHKEDWDVSWRSRLLGWKTLFDPACVAVHPRTFKPGDLTVRRRLDSQMKYHAVKNQLLLLIKNEDPSNFIRDFPFIALRQLMVFFYTLFVERSSVRAYGYVLRHRKRLIAERRLILGRRRASPRSLRQWFTR